MRYYLFATALMLSLWFSTAGHWLATPAPEQTTLLSLDALRQAHSAYGDADEYLLMAQGHPSYAPYRYRLLTPALVRATALPPVLGYVVVNLLCFVLTGVGFTAYLRRDFTPALALLGGVLAVTTFGMTNTVLFPLLEPASYVAFVALLWTARSRRIALFVCVAVLATLTKEIFAFLAAGLWAIETLSEARRSRARANFNLHGD